MGMFDFNPDDVVVSDYGYTSAPMQLAYGGAGGMVSGLGKLAGFQTEEDMLKEIYDNADFETEAGINDVVQKVMAINPEKGAELQKMLTEKSIGQAQLATADLATETAQIQKAKVKHYASLANEFQTTLAQGGLKLTIIGFMNRNGIYYPPDSPPTTYAMATKWINASFGTGEATTATEYRKDLVEEINTMRTAYIDSAIGRIVAGEKAPTTYTKAEVFDAELEKQEKSFEAEMKRRKEANQAKHATLSGISLGAY